MVLLAYASYVLADGLHLSGIVSVLSCGVFMARYVRPNLTPASKDRVRARACASACTLQRMLPSPGSKPQRSGLDCTTWHEWLL